MDEFLQIQEKQQEGSSNKQSKVNNSSYNQQKEQQNYRFQEYIQQQVSLTTEYLSSILEKYIKAASLEIKDIRIKVELLWPESSMEYQQDLAQDIKFINSILFQADQINLENPVQLQDSLQDNSNVLYRKQFITKNLQIKYFDEALGRYNSILVESNNRGLDIQTTVSLSVRPKQDNQNHNYQWTFEISIKTIQISLNMLHLQLFSLLTSLTQSEPKQGSDLLQSEETQIKESIIQQDEVLLEESMLKQVLQQTLHKATGNQLQNKIDVDLQDLESQSTNTSEGHSVLEKTQSQQSNTTMSYKVITQINKIQLQLQLESLERKSQNLESSTQEKKNDSTKLSSGQKSSHYGSVKSMHDTEFHDTQDCESDNFHSPRSQYSSHPTEASTNTQFYNASSHEQFEKQFILSLNIDDFQSGVISSPGYQKTSWLQAGSFSLDLIDEYNISQINPRQYIKQIQIVKCINQSNVAVQHPAFKYEIKYNSQKQRYVPTIRVRDLLWNLNFQLFDNIDILTKILQHHLNIVQQEKQISKPQQVQRKDKLEVKFELELIINAVLVNFNAKKQDHNFQGQLNTGRVIFQFYKFCAKLRTFKVSSQKDLLVSKASLGTLKVSLIQAKKENVLLQLISNQKGNSLHNFQKQQALQIEFQNQINVPSQYDNLYEKLYQIFVTQKIQVNSQESLGNRQQDNDIITQLGKEQVSYDSKMSQRVEISSLIQLRIKVTNTLEIFVNPFNLSYLIMLNTYIQSLIQIESLEVLHPSQKQFLTVVGLSEIVIHVQNFSSVQQHCAQINGQTSDSLDLQSQSMHQQISAENNETSDYSHFTKEQQEYLWQDVDKITDSDNSFHTQQSQNESDFIQNNINLVLIEGSDIYFENIVNIDGYVGRNYNQLGIKNARISKEMEDKNLKSIIQEPQLLLAVEPQTITDVASTQKDRPGFLLQNISQLIPMDSSNQNFVNKSTTSVCTSQIVCNICENDILSTMWDDINQYYLKTFKVLLSQHTQQSQTLTDQALQDIDADDPISPTQDLTPPQFEKKVEKDEYFGDQNFQTSKNSQNTFENKAKNLVQIQESPQFMAMIQQVQVEFGISQKIMQHPRIEQSVKGRIPKLKLKIDSVTLNLQDLSKQQTMSLLNIKLSLVEDNKMRQKEKSKQSNTKNNPVDIDQEDGNNLQDSQIKTILEWLLLEEQFIQASFLMKPDKKKAGKTLSLKATNEEITFYLKKRPILLLNKLYSSISACQKIYAVNKESDENIVSSKKDLKSNYNLDFTNGATQRVDALDKISNQLDAIQDQMDQMDPDNSTLDNNDEDKNQKVQDTQYINLININDQETQINDSLPLNIQSDQELKANINESSQLQETDQCNNQFTTTQMMAQQQNESRDDKGSQQLQFKDIEKLNYYNSTEQDWRSLEQHINKEPQIKSSGLQFQDEGTSENPFSGNQDQNLDSSQEFLDQQKSELEYWQLQKRESQLLQEEENKLNNSQQLGMISNHGPNKIEFEGGVQLEDLYSNVYPEPALNQQSYKKLDQSQEKQEYELQNKQHGQNQDLLNAQSGGQEYQTSHNPYGGSSYDVTGMRQKLSTELGIREDQSSQGQGYRQSAFQNYDQVPFQNLDHLITNTSDLNVQNNQNSPAKIDRIYSGWYAYDSNEDINFQDISSQHSPRKHEYYQYLDGNLNIQEQYIDYINSKSNNISFMEVFPELQQFAPMLQLFQKERVIETFIEQNKVQPANLVLDLQDLKISAILFEYGAQRDQLVKGEYLISDDEEWLEINDEVVQNRQRKSYGGAAELKGGQANKQGLQGTSTQNDQIEPDEFLSYPRLQFKIEGLQVHWSIFSQNQKLQDGQQPYQNVYTNLNTNKHQSKSNLSQGRSSQGRYSSNKQMQDDWLTNFIFVSIQRAWISDFHPTHPTALTWRLIFRSNQYDLYQQRLMEQGSVNNITQECYPDLRLTFTEKFTLDGKRRQNFHFQTNNWRVKLDQQVLLLIKDTLLQGFGSEDSTEVQDDIIMSSEQGDLHSQNSNDAFQFIDQVEKSKEQKQETVVKIDAFTCVADYYPRFLDLKALKEGSVAEMFNILPLAKVKVNFKKLDLNDRDNNNVWEKLVTAWLSDMALTQKENFVRGIPAVKQVWSILEATLSLISSDKRNQRRYRNSRRSFQAYQAQNRGSVYSVGRRLDNFVRVILFESLDLASQVASGTHILLESGHTQLQQTLTLQDGLTKAAVSLKDAFNSTLDGFNEIIFNHNQANYIVKSAYNTPLLMQGVSGQALQKRSKSQRGGGLERQGYYNQRSQSTRSLGKVMLVPLSGAAAALRYTLQGIRNAVEPRQNDETDIFNDW